MPWKISKQENQFCVVKESDNSVEKCHATEEQAHKHMAALYANEPKELIDAIKAGEPWAVMQYYRLFLNKSILPVDISNLESDELGKLAKLAESIASEGEKAAGVDVEKELPVEEVTPTPPVMEPTGNSVQGLIERISDTVKSWFESDDPDPQPFSIVKAADGTYRWLAIYSNKYRDDDGIPEIISSDAHKDFVRAVDDGEWPQPELWYWHVPISSMGKSTMVAYDEAAGFAVASGVFNEGMESVAESLQKQSDLAVSHGMPVSEIQRDADDPTIITRYRSREISLLPLKAAANKLTGSFITSKEDDSMAIDDTKLQALVALGFDVDALTSTVEEAKTQAEEEQRESKEVEVEEDVETKDEVVELEAEAEVVAEVEQVETETEVETEDGKEVTPDPDTQSALEFANFLKEVVAEAVAPINERLDQLEARKQVEEQEAKEEELLDEFTPAASFASMIRSAVLGKEETQVDGRTKEAQGPVQTEVPTRSRTGLPVNTFIDTMLEGGDWREGMGISDNQE
jgi:hypothetical protein